MNSTGRPSSPPLAFTSSRQISRPTRNIFPAPAFGPVRDMPNPILIGSAANAAGAANANPAKIAVVRERPKCVVYGPLRDMPVEPSVILLRLNGKQQMLLHDAWPGLRFEGKPQCHIIPIAKESG